MFWRSKLGYSTKYQITSIMLKFDTSFFEAINKHKKAVNDVDRNSKHQLTHIRHIQKTTIISIRGTKTLRTNNK